MRKENYQTKLKQKQDAILQAVIDANKKLQQQKEDNFKLRKLQIIGKLIAQKLKEKNLQITFIITAEVEIYYKASFYEYDEGIRYPKETTRNKTITTAPITDKREKIKEYVDDINYEDDYKRITVLDYKVDIMDISNFKTYIKKEKQPMTRAFVLRNDWLKFSHGIAEYAFDDADGKCVYY